MIPGVGYLYSGLLRRKNALNQLWLCMVTIGVVSFQVRTHSDSSPELISVFSGIYLDSPWHSRRLVAPSSAISNMLPSSMYWTHRLWALLAFPPSSSASISSCSPRLRPCSPSVPSPSAGSSARSSSLSLSGQPWYTTPLPTGPGIPTDGRSNSEV
jgi:hypothetical protein